MQLEKISLYQFKNYEEASIACEGQLNCFIGKNGAGKTNILDAIHYLAFGKSAFVSVDQLSIRNQEPAGVVNGTFSMEGFKHSVAVSLMAGRKKEVLWDKKPYEKLSEHVGKIPLVLISPYDTDLVREGSEFRRKFFDHALSQKEAHYLDILIKYNHWLKQRNMLLKQFYETRRQDLGLLEAYDEPMAAAAEEIYAFRKRFLEEYVPVFQENYRSFSDENEIPTITFETQVEPGHIRNQWKTNLSADIQANRTLIGPHGDDYVFLFNGKSVKKMGSQGQQKSYVIALKLAVFLWLAHQTNKSPLLLLDDVFDRLDPNRIQKLMDMVSKKPFGQVFVTDTDEKRCRALFAQQTWVPNFFQVSDGTVVRIP